VSRNKIDNITSYVTDLNGELDQLGITDKLRGAKVWGHEFCFCCDYMSLEEAREVVNKLYKFFNEENV
jgi:hypothetical protein